MLYTCTCVPDNCPTRYASEIPAPKAVIPEQKDCNVGTVWSCTALVSIKYEGLYPQLAFPLSLAIHLFSSVRRLSVTALVP
jgi:hypothetical protein